MIGRLVLIFLLVGAAATAQGDDDALFRDVTNCIRGATGTAGIDPSMVPRLFTRECSAACPGLQAYSSTPPGGDSSRALASGCPLFCSEKAASAFEATRSPHRWQQLAATCGPGYYGLSPAQVSLFSDVWFVVHVVGDWLVRANGEAGPRSRMALDDLGKTLPRVRWVLPLPASLPGRYDDLAYGGSAVDSVFAPDYVVVGAHDVTMGAIPEAKLTLGGAKLLTDWPGQLVSLASLAKRQATFRRRPPPVAGANRGVLGPPPSPADATLRVVRASAPLVLIDADSNAARLVDVVEALGENGARLGVRSADGAVGEHSVLLTTRPVSLGRVTDHLSLQHLGVPREKLDGQRGVVVWVNAQNATVRELVDTMNRLYDTGVRLVVLDDEDEGLMAPTHGSLDKEVIKGVITQHLNEVKRCYERGLAHRAMSGRVMVQFVVAPNGSVGAAIVHDSTLGDSEVEHCITDAAKTWTFPKPTGGGLVVVSYPFVLKQAERPRSSP